MPLKVNTSFELCAGKKIYLPDQKQYHVKTLHDGTHQFTEMPSPFAPNKSWILGGQDSCHVGFL